SRAAPRRCAGGGGRGGASCRGGLGSLGPPRASGGRYAPWHFLYFLPEPHQLGSFRPIFSFSPFTTVSCSWIGPPLPAWAFRSIACSAATSGPDAVATAAWPSADGCSAVPPAQATG